MQLNFTALTLVSARPAVLVFHWQLPIGSNIVLSITRGNNQTKPFSDYKPAKVIGFNFNFCNSFKLIEAAAATVCGCLFPVGIEQKEEKSKQCSSRTQRLMQELCNFFFLSKAQLAISSALSFMFLCLSPFLPFLIPS